jgi:hypothetical protein
LLADDALSLDTLDLAIRARDDPFPRDQLRHLAAEVGDADVILEQVRSITRGASVGDELAAHLDANAARRGVAHPDPASRRHLIVAVYSTLLTLFVHKSQDLIMPWSLT